MVDADEQGAADLLKWDLRHSAAENWSKAQLSARRGDTDSANTHLAACSLCERLAADADRLAPDVLAAYTAARHVEQHLRPGTPVTIHASMTMEIGFLLAPKTIEDLCRIYIGAVEGVRADPRWTAPDADMHEFWSEYAKACHT